MPSNEISILMDTLGENPVPSTWSAVLVPEQWYSRYFWEFMFSWLNRSATPDYLSGAAFLYSLSHDQRSWMQQNIHSDYLFDKKTACLWFQDPQEAMLFRFTFC